MYTRGQVKAMKMVEVEDEERRPHSVQLIPRGAQSHPSPKSRERGAYWPLNFTPENPSAKRRNKRGSWSTLTKIKPKADDQCTGQYSTSFFFLGETSNVSEMVRCAQPYQAVLCRSRWIACLQSTWGTTRMDATNSGLMFCLIHTYICSG